MQPLIILDISAFIFQGEHCCTGVDLAYPCGLREAGPRNSGGAAVRRGKGEDDAGAGDQGADGAAQERHEQKRSPYCIGQLLSICLLSPVPQRVLLVTVAPHLAALSRTILAGTC